MRTASPTTQATPARRTRRSRHPAAHLRRDARGQVLAPMATPHRTRGRNPRTAAVSRRPVAAAVPLSAVPRRCHRARLREDRLRPARLGRSRCVGEWCCARRYGLDRPAALTRHRKRVRGRAALVIGIANTGGVIGASWIPSLVEALESGLDIVSGMHVKLGAMPQLTGGAERYGRRLIDIRTPPPNIPSAPAPSAPASACSRSAPTARSARNTPRWRSRAPSRRAACRSTSAPPGRPAS